MIRNMDSETYSRKEILFLLGLSLYLMETFLSLTMFDRISFLAVLSRPMRYAGSIFCILSFLETKCRSEFLMRALGVGAILIITVKITGDKLLLFAFLVLLGASGISSVLIMKWASYIRGVLLAITVLAALSGIIQDYVFIQGDRIRHGLGFTWTTTGAIIYAFLMFQIVYIRQDEMKWKGYLGLELINCFFYVYTNTRMVFYLSSIFLVFSFLSVKTTWLNRMIRNMKWLLLTSPLIIGTITIGLHAVYRSDNLLMNKLNAVINGRLELGKRALDDYGIHLLGQKIVWVGFSIDNPEGTPAYNYVDSSYIKVLLDYGILVLILVLVLYIVLLYRAYETEDYLLSVIVCFILLFAITEPRLIDLIFNLFPLLAVSGLKKKERNFGNESA